MTTSGCAAASPPSRFMRPAIGSQLCQRRGDVCRRVAQRVQHAGDGEQVVDVEAAQQRRLQRRSARRPPPGRTTPARVERDVVARARRPGAVRAQRRRHGRRREASRADSRPKASSRLITAARSSGHANRRALASPYARHVAVVVEVVAGEVGEHGDIEMHAIDATLVERVRD